MSEQNKTNVRRLFEEVWNKGHVPVADELFTATYTHHDSSSPDLGRGPDSEKKRVLFTAMPSPTFVSPSRTSLPKARPWWLVGLAVAPTRAISMGLHQPGSNSTSLVLA